MSIELKIKIKNLADEARTIRTEENKLQGMAKWNLQHHRKTVVRQAARRSQIAYQMCRGRDWQSCTSHSELTRWGDWKEIERMVRKYGSAEAVTSLPKLERQFKATFLGEPFLSGDDHAENACSNAA
jgi:hypothetical protein